MSDSPNPRFWGLQSAAPGAKAAMIVLLLINLFNYIDRQILAGLVPHIKETLLSEPDNVGSVVGFLMKALSYFVGGSAENALVGLLAMAFLVSYMLAAPFLSSLRVRDWYVIAGGVIFWSLATGASGLATSFGMLLLMRCLVGVGEAAFGPRAPSLIASFFTLESRNKALALFYMMMPIGCALGVGIAGVFTGFDWGWRWAFIAVVPPGILLGILSIYLPTPKSQLALAGKAEPVSRWKEYKGFLKNKSYLTNTLAMTAMTFAIGGIGFWMPSYVNEFRGGGSLSQVNIIFGVIMVVTGLAATYFGGWLADRLQPRLRGSYFQVSGYSMILAFPCMLGILYVPFPYAWFFVFLTCFCLFMNTGPSNTALANVIPPAQRSSAFALNILIIHLFGDVTSPLVIGVITDATGKNMNIAFMVVSVLLLIGGVIWLIGSRYLDEDTRLIAQKETDEEG